MSSSFPQRGKGKPPFSPPPPPPKITHSTTTNSMSMSVGQGEEEDELVSKKSAPSTIAFGNKNLTYSSGVHRSPSTEKLSMNNHNNKRPRASMDGFPMEDDCHPRTLNSKRFLSDAMANELGWKWSLEETNGNNNTQQTETTTTTTSLSMDGNQSRRQSMDLDTTSHSRENNNTIIISPSSMHGNNNNATANALRRTVSASDVSGEDSLLNNGGGSMDLLRRRAMKYAQEQKNLKEFHFPKALEVVVADQEVDEEKEKSNSNNSNPTTPRNDDNVLEEVAPASFYPASPSDQSPLMTNLRKAALLRSLSRGKQQQQQQQQQQRRHGGSK
ncbi:unnamed protein product [Bathycoccus prasinos]